jgi:dephospho-CoA kinase
MTAPIVGLTGGIACGKSAAANRFRALGIEVVDADQVARDLVEPGTEGLDEIVTAFGREVLRDDGALDREKLGACVFGDDAARATLNGILHPRIAAESGARLAKAAETDAPYAIYDAALLVENGSYRMFAGLVVVTCDEKTQRARLVARNGYSPEEARARIRAQMPLAEKVAVADYVIDNRGTMADLDREVTRVHDALVARFAAGSTRKDAETKR